MTCVVQSLPNPLHQIELLLTSGFSHGTEFVSDIAQAKVIVVGVPLRQGVVGTHCQHDLAPTRLRFHSQLWSQRPQILDLGDLRCECRTLLDTGLYPHEIGQERQRRWGALGDAYQLPVAPLSMLERLIDCLFVLNPSVRLGFVGGNHSFSYVPIKVLARRCPGKLGILHFDAHPDACSWSPILNHASWVSFVLNEVGDKVQFQQVGFRQWDFMEPYDIPVITAADVLTKDFSVIIDRIMKTFQSAGVQWVYITNDIDGTDPVFAPATGDPEPGGFHPDFCERVIEAVGRVFPVVGSDVVEVNPSPIQIDSGDFEKTLQVAGRYLDRQIQTMLSS